MGATELLLEGLIPLVGSTLLRDRQQAAARLWQRGTEAVQVRATRREAGLPAPPIAFVSLTSPSAFARCDCMTSLHGWSIDVPRPMADRVLTEAERAGVVACALTGRGPWLDDGLFHVLAVHSGTIFLLGVRPEDLGREAAERLAELPHVLPLLETWDAAAGFCDGPTAPAAKRAMEALRSFRVPYGFSVTAGEGNLPHLMGLGFYNACLQERASFGLIVDCLQIPSCDDRCRPLRPSERAALGKHVSELRGRLGGFFAYFPWDLAESGWCLAAPHQNGSGAKDRAAFTLLHVEPSGLGKERRLGGDVRLFESLRISPMGELARAAIARDTTSKRTQGRPVVGGAVG